MISSKLIAESICVWLAFWAIRRKYELDYKLDRSMQALRWLVVVGAILLARYAAETSELLRVLSALVFLSFLAWPNLAYHLVRVSRELLATSSKSG